jgi:hypothetical protein
VRLSINPGPLIEDGHPDALEPSAIGRLDKTVAEIMATGATWSTPFLKQLHGVPYSSTPENIAPLLALETDDIGKQLAHYGTERWDAKHVDLEIATAASWGMQHKVPVWCGEFGVFRTYAEPAARALWLHDMRVALDAHASRLSPHCRDNWWSSVVVGLKRL